MRSIPPARRLGGTKALSPSKTCRNQILDGSTKTETPMGLDICAQTPGEDLEDGCWRLPLLAQASGPVRLDGKEDALSSRTTGPRDHDVRQCCAGIGGGDDSDLARTTRLALGLKEPHRGKADRGVGSAFCVACASDQAISIYAGAILNCRQPIPISATAFPLQTR